jgi:hypothetical protein
VELSVWVGSGRTKSLSVALRDRGLEEAVLDCLVDISTWDGFKGDVLEDRFPLSHPFSSAETRFVWENIARTRGHFALWQRHPAERMVLGAGKTPEQESIIECPGLPAGTDGQPAGLQEAIKQMRDLYGDALEVRASFLVWRAQRTPTHPDAHMYLRRS